MFEHNLDPVAVSFFDVKFIGTHLLIFLVFYLLFGIQDY